MKLLDARTNPISIALVIAFAGLACDDDSSSGTPGGSSGAGPSAQAGQPSGGTGGTGSTVTPDEQKDCGDPGDPAVPELTLTEIATDLERPVYLTQARGDDTRLFVLEKPGRIRIIRVGAEGEPGELVERPFLDIVDRVSERSGGPAEMGLLGLAFHPEYADNGRFYVYYSAIVDGEHNGRLSEFTISPDDEELADPASERVLFEVEQPEDNHNGGDVEFGPDGMLYLGLGDGGGANDQHGAIGNGQNLETLLGKLLRIDVDGTGSGPNGAYAIPSGNMGGEALPEIWSYGWRNPWRFSFDGCTGAMYIADVGQNEIEEVNYEPPGVSGRNYGWRLMEGDACFNPSSGCNAATQNLTLPVAVYDHDAGLSITGGYVYRGRAIPDLRGVYLYADYVTNRFFALRMDGEAVAREQEDITDNINPMGDVRDITSFGQSNDGEVYVLSLAGSVYRVDPE